MFAKPSELDFEPQTKEGQQLKAILSSHIGIMKIAENPNEKLEAKFGDHVTKVSMQMQFLQAKIERQTKELERNKAALEEAGKKSDKLKSEKEEKMKELRTLREKADDLEVERDQLKGRLELSELGASLPVESKDSKELEEKLAESKQDRHLMPMTNPSRKRRSGCPINFGLEIFGDRWSLLILRDLLMQGKCRFGEFAQSEERIATNVLTDRLTRLEQAGLVIRRRDEGDGRQVVYAPTDAGRALLPRPTEKACKDPAGQTLAARARPGARRVRGYRARTGAQWGRPGLARRSARPSPA